MNSTFCKIWIIYIAQYLLFYASIFTKGCFDHSFRNSTVCNNNNKQIYRPFMDASQSAESAPIATLRSENSSSFSKQKNRTTLVTAQKPPKATPESIIAEQYDELNRYIDLLKPKIQKVVEFNEAEVLVAYRNHFDKIKYQIQRFKQQTLAQVRNQANVLQKMIQMEKQLKVFREEALRLFELVAEKDKIIEQLNLKLEELLGEKKYMNARVKELMKVTKDVQIMKNRYDSQILSGKQTNQQKFGKTYQSIGIHSYKKSILRDRKIKDRTLTVSNCEYEKSLEEDRLQTKSNFHNFHKQSEIKTIFRLNFSHLEPSLLDKIIKTAEEVCEVPKQSSFWAYTKTNNTTDMKRTKYSLKAKPNHCKAASEEKRRSFSRSTFQQESEASTISSKTQHLGEFFERCVETVRREVARRTNKATINFFKAGNVGSLQEFKKIDFYRLLQLVCGNEQVIKLLYDALVMHRF